ncbi:MAG: hypothetical protein AAGH89_18745, partial [Verrucomicrobiota bacterium]
MKTNNPLLDTRRRLWLVFGAALAVCLAFVLTSESTDSSESQLRAKELEVSASGAEIISTRLIDLDGNLHILGAGRPPTAVAMVFLGPDCPISRRSIEALNQLAGEDQTVKLFGIISDPGVDRAAAVAFQSEFEVSFPIVLDSIGDLALRLKPEIVPEAFVISGADEVVYRGAIDDRFASPGRPRKQASANYLQDAMEAAGRGEEPEIAKTEPVGCIFEAWDDIELPETLTYHQHVAPIVHANCVNCHREGQAAPFELTNYDLTRRKAKMIAWVCEDELMPPWLAEPHFNRFVDQRALSNRQIEALDAWAQSKAPEGNAESAFPLPKFPPADEWPLGKPDLVLKLPEPFEVYANGDDILRHFVLPTGVPEDKELVAMDFRPGEPEVVHHVIFHRDSTGKARKLKSDDGLPGYNAFSKEARSKLTDVWGFEVLEPIGGWAPGQQPYQLPDDMALPFPANGDIVLEVHYHPSGRKVFDQSEVALYFSDKPVKYLCTGIVAGTEDIDIPAGEANYQRHTWLDIKASLTLFDVAP